MSFFIEHIIRISIIVMVRSTGIQDVGQSWVLCKVCEGVMTGSYQELNEMLAVSREVNMVGIRSLCLQHP